MCCQVFVNKGEFRSRPISAFVYISSSKPIRMRKLRNVQIIIGGYSLGLLPLLFLYFTMKSKYAVWKEFFLNFTVAIFYLWRFRKDIVLQT